MSLKRRTTTGLRRYSDGVPPSEQPQRSRGQGDHGRERKVVRRQVPEPHHERLGLLSGLHAGEPWLHVACSFWVWDAEIAVVSLGRRTSKVVRSEMKTCWTKEAFTFSGPRLP